MFMPERIIKYNEAIKEATDQMMSTDLSVYIIGLGIPNGMGGTTSGLKAKYPNRVFDAPTAEASYTGMAVGSAINGLKPVVHFDRVEFSLFAADQIFTQAAKWNYMFGGNNNVPIVFRIVIGRQWGNGPQHSQALYSMFGSVTGLKAVIPSTPQMAKGLIASAIKDLNPVIILEPRWVYNIKQHVPEGLYFEPLDKAKVVKEGKDITVVAYGDGYISTLDAIELVKDKVDVELIDLVSINPVDHKTISNSVRKTGRLMFVDTTSSAFSPGSEVISKIAQDSSVRLKNAPITVSCPHIPCPTTPALSEFYYPTKIDIANKILGLFNEKLLEEKLSFEEVHIAPTKTIL